jgi:hypothetical protein
LIDQISKKPVVDQVITFKLAGINVASITTDVRGSVRVADDALRQNDVIEIVIAAGNGFKGDSTTIKL